MWQSSTRCFLKMVHSALNNDRFIKQLRLRKPCSFIIVTNIISHFEKVFKSCQNIKTHAAENFRGVSLTYHSYGTRVVVVVALSFAVVVVSATEKSVFAVVVVVVVASLAAAYEESSVAGFEAAPALVVV